MTEDATNAVRPDVSAEGSGAVSVSDTVVNFGECAVLLGVSETTLRKLLKSNPDFPVEKLGGNGDPYEFDAVRVAEWKNHHDRELADAAVQRGRDVETLRLELFGGETVDAETAGLTAQQRAAEFAAEAQATRLAELRGALVRADDVRAMSAQVFAMLREDMLALGGTLAKDLELNREQRLALMAKIEKGLRASAARLGDPASYETAAIDNAA